MVVTSTLGICLVDALKTRSIGVNEWSRTPTCEATGGRFRSSVRHGGRELHSAKIHEIPGAPGVEGGGYASTI
jgi:hypothetical protein